MFVSLSRRHSVIMVLASQFDFSGNIIWLCFDYRIATHLCTCIGSIDVIAAITSMQFWVNDSVKNEYNRK